MRGAEGSIGQASPRAGRDLGGEGRAVPERRRRPQSTWAAGPTGRTEEPGGGIAKCTLLAEGRLQAGARPQPRGPQPSPPAWPPKWPREPSASEALTGRVTLGMFGNIGGCCHQRGRCYGGQQGGHRRSQPGLPRCHRQALEALYTLDLNLTGTQARDRPADCVCSLYLKPRQAGRPLPC